MGFYKIDIILVSKNSTSTGFIEKNGTDYVLEKIVQPNLIKIRGAKTERTLVVCLDKDKDYLVKLQ